jgi:hypothetical protein
MIDIEVKKFYSSVKDPSWPDVHTYLDYCRLPANIKNECNVLHQFQSRKEEICQADHWIKPTLAICVYENLAYVPVPKCAQCYYGTVFNNLGWKKVMLSDVDIENTTFFGTMMHPLQRRLKGITEWLVDSYRIGELEMSTANPWMQVLRDVNWSQLKSDIKTTHFKNMLKSLTVGDSSSMPYTTMFGSLLNKVNWIPMDTMTSDQAKISMMKLFNLHGHSIQLPLGDQHIHVSSANQLEIFEIIKSIFYNNPEQHYNLYKFYGNDLKFYYNLLDNFSPDWQHL